MSYERTLLASAHGTPIAVEERNTLRLATVALGQLAVTPFDPGRPKRDFEIEFVPVAGAFVVCMQRTLGGKAFRGPLPIHWGRTNDLGWILEPDEDALYADVPPARRLPYQSLFGEPVGGELPVPAQDQMQLNMGESYDVYWSFERERFDEVAEQLRANPGATPRELPCQRFTFQARHANPLPDLDLLGDALRMRVGQFLLRSEDRGFVVGSQYGQDVCLFDVTPEPLRALYLCEFLRWYEVRAMEASGPYLTTLTRARNLAEAFAHGSPDIHMEAQFPARPGSPEREVLDHYRDYAWQCAANDVEKNDFWRSLNVTVTNYGDPSASWRNAAEDIGRRWKGKVVHPAFRGLKHHRLILNGLTQEVLVDYFQFYQFGGRLKRRAVAAQITSSLTELSHTVEANSDLVRQILSARASIAAFADALDYGTPRDEALREELHERYLATCSDVELAWWNELESYRPDDWTALSKRLKWATGLAGGGGKLLKNFLDQRLKSYKLAGKTANTALTQLFRYHSALFGQTRGAVFERNLPKLKAQVRVDFGQQTITVLSAQEGLARVAEPIDFVFTTVKQPLPGTPPGNMQQARRRYTQKPLIEVVDYDVELPVDVQKTRQLGAEVPAALGVACSLLNAVTGLFEAREKLRDGFKLDGEHVEAWYQLGKNTLGVVDSLATLQDAMAPKVDGHSPFLKKLESALKGAKRAVGVVDAGLGLARGIELMFSDDGALAYELRQGRSVRAFAQGVKGVAQIASAVTGGAMEGSSLVLFGAAEATGFLAAAAGPVGIAIVCAGLLVTCIDGVLDLTKELNAQVDAFEQAFDAAQRKELRAAPGLVVTERLHALQRRAHAARLS